MSEMSLPLLTASMPSSFPQKNDDDRKEDLIIRHRERNKEHARKTRMRKKEQLQALKSKVHELEEEAKRLKQEIEDCSIASILVGLSSGGKIDDNVDLTATVSASPTNYGESLASGKRKRFLSLDEEGSGPEPMKLNIKGSITLVGGSSHEGKTQINWKTGVYYDDEGKHQQLTQSELEALRRERNRMHAKMTRDRKKCYVASIKRVITKLEQENQALREKLREAQAASDKDNDAFGFVEQSINSLRQVEASISHQREENSNRCNFVGASSVYTAG